MPVVDHYLVETVRKHSLFLFLKVKMVGQCVDSVQISRPNLGPRYLRNFNWPFGDAKSALPPHPDSVKSFYQQTAEFLITEKASLNAAFSYRRIERLLHSSALSLRLRSPLEIRVVELC